MNFSNASDNRTGRQVLVVDPQCTRRQRLVRRSREFVLAEAASLCEAFPLAEQLSPQAIALSADFAVEPEVGGLLRLAEILGSRVFFYRGEGQPLKRLAVAQDLPCIPLQADDAIGDLLVRLADSRMHLRGSLAQDRLPDLVLIGASTGGITAIEAVLTAFPADCPPTLVVQHIRDGFVAGLVKRLDSRVRPRVTEAVDGDRLLRGTVYFAPDCGRHLAIAGHAQPRCTLVSAEPRHGHRPSVDVLFESAVHMGRAVSAALLTGMGADGAAGLGALRRAGAHTVAQDRASSVVWGMPRVAIESGAAAEVLPPDRIGPSLLIGQTARQGRAEC